MPNITSIAPNPASGLSTSAFNLVTITGTAFGSSRASSNFITFANGSTDKGAFHFNINSHCLDRHADKGKGTSICRNRRRNCYKLCGTKLAYSLTIDSVVPVITSFAINSSESTTSPTVSLAMEATDCRQAYPICSLQTAQAAHGQPLKLTAHQRPAGHLLAGPGTKTVYVKIFDNAGNYSIRSDTISLMPDISSNSSKPGIRPKLISL